MDTRTRHRSVIGSRVCLLIFASAVTSCIAQSDQVTSVEFSSATFTGSESSGEIIVTITATGTISDNIDVMITLTEGTAKGNDFSTTFMNATIPAGATNTTVRVAVTSDDIVEGNETFSMSLNVPSSLGPGVVAGSVTSATGIIIDSSTIRVRFTRTQYTGSEATGFVMVTLELVGGISSDPFNVAVTPSEQSPLSAEGGVDFDTTTLTATFDSWMTMSSVSVPVIDDMLAEGQNETLNLMLIVPSSHGPAITAGGRNRATGVIIDTTMLVVEFESGQYTGSESSGFVEVIVIISGGSSTTPLSVMITISTAGQSASRNDLNTELLFLTFAPNEVNKTARISVECDKRSESRERFDISFILTSNTPQVRTGRDRSVGIIRDSTVVVNFKQSSYEVMEDGGEVMIMIELSQPSSEPFEVMISLTNATAERTKDYQRQSDSIMVPADTRSTTFTINIINDDVSECDESFKLTLSVPSSTCGVVSGGTDTTEVTIKDDDRAVFSFNQSQYSIEENITPLSVGLILSRRASKDVIVEVTITDGSAKAGIDYGNSSQSLVYNVTITAGMTSSSFDVDIIDNMIQDGDKMFTITIRLISICLPLTINNDTTTVTIIDDEVVKIQFASATFTGSESSGEIIVTIIETEVISDDNITVMITLIEGTAKGNDFNTTPLTATIPAGATNTTVRVAVTSDNIVEGDEMFSMSLNVPSSLGPGVVAGSVTSATGIIIDSSTIRVRFTHTQYTGSEATGFVMVTLELVGGISSNPFNVTVTPSEQSPLSAEGGVDFDTTTLTATFDSGMTMSSVVVPVIDDMLAEGLNETFNLMLTVPSSLGPVITAGGRNRATGVIIDTTMLVVEFESGQYTGSESSGFVEVVLIISGGSSTTPIRVMITVTTTGQSASRNDLRTGPFDLTIASNEVNKTARILVECDKRSESRERFDISLILTSNNPQVRTGRDRSVGIIRDSTVVVNFKQSSYEIMEDGGKVMIMIELSQPSPEPFEVMINLMDATAKRTKDYQRQSNNVMVPADTRSTTFIINIINDNVSECDESFKLILSVPSSTCGVVVGGTDTIEVTIKDEDGAVLSFNQSQYSIEENITPLSVGLMLSRRASKDIVVEVTITDGSAKAGIDYGNSSQSLVYNVTITAGMTSSSFDVDIIDNMIQDGNKVFTITIRLISTCLTIPVIVSRNVVMVTIRDNEVTKIEFASTTFTGSESSGEISVIVVATGATSNKNITVRIILTEETAKGNDFDTTSLTATIPAGTTNTTVRVAVTSDNIVEGDEIFSMSLNVPSSLGPGVVAGPVTSAKGIIIDSSTIRVRFTHTQYTGSEATGFVMVTLEVVGGTSSNPFNVTVTPSEQSPVSAEGGVDFDTTTLTTTFDSGMTMSSVVVPVIDDMLAEGQNETFNLMLTVPSSLGPAITAGGRNRARGVIIDTTMLVVEFESGQYTGSESSGLVEVIVIISGGSSTTPLSVMITITTTGQSASRNDINTEPIILTFAPNEVNKTARISVECDKRSESRERFDISLTLTSNNPQVRTGRDRSVGIIRDSTIVVNFKQSSYEVMEDGGEVMIMIELSQPSSEPFEVMISLMDATAKRTNDYQRQSSNVMVPADTRSTTFTINITIDDVLECDESFKLALSVASSTCGVVSGGTNTTEVTIKDDDGAVFSFNQSQYSIEENITPLSVGLMLSRRASKDVIVEVTITDGSAKAGIDYGNSSQSLVYNVTITAGMTSSSFDVDIIDNMIQDGNKMFTITIRLISICLPLSINNDTTTVIIIDDEVLRVQFASTTFSGSESSGQILIAVSITGGIPTVIVSFNVKFVESTATGYDFNTTNLTAAIPAGATNTTVRVAVTSDNIVEGDEMFSMSLNVPSSLGPGVIAGPVTSATGIIIDSSTIRVRFTRTQYTGIEATGFVMVTLELVGGTSSNPFNVTVTPSEQSPVSAEGGVDFDTTSLTATFDSGMIMSNVSVPVIDDDIIEGDETFRVILNILSLHVRGIYAGGRNSATLIITDSTVAARIISNPISITMLENSTVTLSCEATASGFIRYQWRRVNGEISSDRAEGVNTPNLTISSIQQEDEDEYYCVASYGVVNGMNHSDESEIAAIIVYGPPMLQPINPVYYFIPGDPFALNCTATNDPQSPNELRFRWFKESTRIINDSSRWNITELSQNTLTITSQLSITLLMVEQHNGTYTCFIDNFKIRTAVYQITTIVVEIPAIITTQPPPAVIVFNGLNVTLSCEATGSGFIRYQWRRVNGEISSDRADGVSMPTLTISPITEQDEDRYYCVASNGGKDGLLYNDQSQRAIIIVYGPPTLQEFNTVYYVIAGDSFTLNCTATNDVQSPNELRFRWFRGLTEIDSNSLQWNITELSIDVFTVTSQLVITNLTVDKHNGTYSCRVDNHRIDTAVNQNTIVIVEIPCIVVVHPQSQLTQTGDTIVLSCDATGNGPIKYQWMRVNGEITSDRTEGVNTSTLTISPVTVREEDEYYCVVSSGGGRFNDTSNVAVIAVVEADPRSEFVEDASDDSDNSHIIIIAVLSVLLIMTLISIVILVIWIIKSNKKIGKLKKNSSHKNASEPAYELVTKSTPSDVKVEKNPAYSVSDTSADHHYDFISDIGGAKVKKQI